jgi:hypothetical protein
MTCEPHAKRHPGRGWLKHGGRPGNWDNAPRCAAKTRKGTPCRAAAMKNGRCRMHGGGSTGPKTAEGIERIRKSRTKHGRYSKASIAMRRESRQTIQSLRASLRTLIDAGDDIEEADCTIDLELERAR